MKVLCIYRVVKLRFLINFAPQNSYSEAACFGTLHADRIGYNFILNPFYVICEMTATAWVLDLIEINVMKTITGQVF